MITTESVSCSDTLYKRSAPGPHNGPSPSLSFTGFGGVDSRFYDDDGHLFELHAGSLRERLATYASRA